MERLSNVPRLVSMDQGIEPLQSDSRAGTQSVDIFKRNKLSSIQVDLFQTIDNPEIISLCLWNVRSAFWGQYSHLVICTFLQSGLR